MLPRLDHVLDPRASVSAPLTGRDGWSTAAFPIVPIPLAPPASPQGLMLSQPTGARPSEYGLLLTAGASKTVRAVAKTTFKKYAELYMGQKQHPIHVLRDMRKHPERADRAIGETVAEFAASALFKIARDLFEDWTPVAHTLLTIQEVFGRGRAFVARGDDGKLHIQFRRLKGFERVLFFIAALIPIFPINTIYDIATAIYQVVWGAIKAIFIILSTPFALIRGPRNYDMKTGQVISPPLSA